MKFSVSLVSALTSVLVIISSAIATEAPVIGAVDPATAVEPPVATDTPVLRTISVTATRLEPFDEFKNKDPAAPPTPMMEFTFRPRLFAKVTDVFSRFLPLVLKEMRLRSYKTYRNVGYGVGVNAHCTNLNVINSTVKNDTAFRLAGDRITFAFDMDIKVNTRYDAQIVNKIKSFWVGGLMNVTMTGLRVEGDLVISRDGSTSRIKADVYNVESFLDSIHIDLDDLTAKTYLLHLARHTIAPMVSYKVKSQILYYVPPIATKLFQNRKVQSLNRWGKSFGYKFVQTPMVMENSLKIGLELGEVEDDH